MRLIRLGLRGLLGLLGLLILLALVIVAMNSFDESPLDLTHTLRLRPVMPIAPGQNLYLAMLGNDAPRGQSPVVDGQRKIAEYETNLPLVLKDPQTPILPQHPGAPPRLTFQGRFELASPSRTSIWVGLENRRAEFDTLLKDNHELYDRYRTLGDLQGYQETATPSPFTPYTFPPRDVRSLFLVTIALRLKSGRLSEQKGALVDLEHDIRAWHTVLTQGESLLPRLLAMLHVLADDSIVADMVADDTIKIDPLIPELDRLTTPFDLADWKLGDAAVGEFRAYEPLVEQMKVLPLRTLQAIVRNDSVGDETPFRPKGTAWEPVARHFFKFNATENLRSEDAAQAIVLANTDPPELLEARQRYLDWRQRHLEFPTAASFYNPLGKRMLEGILYRIDDYVLRGYDVAAFQRLTKSGYEIRRQHISRDQIPAFLLHHPEWATHPVNGQAFSWDALGGTLAFHPLEEKGSYWRSGIRVYTDR